MVTDYIGWDWDEKDEVRMLMAYFNARYMYPGVPVEVRTTRRGFHIKIKKEATIEEDIQVRRILGDDPDRLWYSELHAKWGMPDWTIDVLFDRKESLNRKNYTKIIRPY